MYVTGLPTDATEEEVGDLFKKAGVFLIDPVTEKPKIKLYRDAQGQIKGDALIIYLREESVGLAIDLMDDTPFRDFEPHQKIQVQQAEFQEKQTQEQKESKVNLKKKKEAIQKMKK